MQHSEYLSWRRFYQSHPWGCDVDDQRIATLCAILVNVNGGFKGGKSAKPEDFFVRTKRSDEANIATDNRVMIAKMEAAFAAHNVRVDAAAD